MTRDIEDRLRMFTGEEIEVNRIALNMDQIRKYNPPPNPAKLTDSRAKGYIREFGKQSWELDALDPKVIHSLIEKTVLSYRDDSAWNKAVKVEKGHRAKLSEVAQELAGE